MIFALVVPLEQEVKDFDVAVIGESQVSDTPVLALLHEPVKNAVVDIARVEILQSILSHTDAVHHKEIHIIHLQILQ